MKKEIEYIQSLIKEYPRSSNQMNRPFHSDAEVLKIPNGYLGVSVDAISEEIELQLINDPRTLGWLTVTASVSDLSAIGMKTERISLLLKDSQNDEKWRESFFEGVLEACSEYEISETEKIIGKGTQRLTACTAYGFAKSAPTLSRVGLKAGDSLFLTGPVGWGNAVALVSVALKKAYPDLAEKYDRGYRPKARWREARLIEEFSQSCIDTSDGLLSTLKWLEIFNQVKLTINYDKSLFHKVALEVASLAKVNPWLFMAAQNGEFELLFSISQKNKKGFLEKASASGLSFIEIGTVSEGNGISLILQENEQKVEKELVIDHLLDMLHEGVDPEKYIRTMLGYASENFIKFEEVK